MHQKLHSTLASAMEDRKRGTPQRTVYHNQGPNTPTLFTITRDLCVCVLRYCFSDTFHAPNVEKKSLLFTWDLGGLLGRGKLVGALPDEGADRMFELCGGGMAKFIFPLDGADCGTVCDGVDIDPIPALMLFEPTPVMVALLPNLAAMRARASSRSRVCRITYCSSDSPVNRSIPFRSSPGKPCVSCKNAEPEPLVNDEDDDGGGGRWGDARVPLLLLLYVSDPKPAYTLLVGFCAAT